MKMMLVFNTLDALLAIASTVILLATQAGRANPSSHIYLVATFCVVIATHQIVSLAVNLKIQQRLKRARADNKTQAAQASLAGETEASAHALNPADPGLFADAQRMSSVTENTTELLDGATLKPEQRQTTGERNLSRGK